jgi:UDP:flavonoid glycosyltransferase YjiC (YdhE family)
MPPRSKVLSLPEEDRKWLDAALVAGHFQDYRALAEELQRRGYEISHAAVWRYGTEFERSLGAVKLATEQARAIAEAAGDDEGALNDAVIRLIQTKSFEVLTKLATEDIDESFVDLGTMLSRLGKVAIDQKKWAATAREKIAKKLEALEEQGKQGKGSIDPETVRRVREEIYGLV